MTELSEHESSTDPDTRSALIAVLRATTPSSVAPSHLDGTQHAPSGRAPLQRVTILVTLLLMLIGVALLGLLLGSISVAPSDVWSVLWHRIGGDAFVTPTWSRSTDLVIADVRLPRVLLAGIVGAALAVAGMRSEEHTSELQSRFELVCRL